MAKSSTPSRAPRNAPQSGKEHRYIGALARDDFGRMSLLTATTAHAWAKKKIDTASQTLALRTERNEKKARRAEAREYRRAEAGLQAELRESDHRARLLSRLIRTKVKPEKKLHRTPPRARPRRWPFASVALPKYDGPVVDRRGERGVFARFRYYSRRTALEGVSQRVLAYCWNGADLDVAGDPYSHSNVGETIDEALCAFDHLEQVNWSASSYAKLLMHGILAMDHRQTPDEMMEVGVRWAEEALGRFDLPYLVTLHAPPPDGDQRNWHCHVLWSFRPMEQVGDHEWLVGEMLRTDLDNPRAMKLMREMFAAVMTDASFEAGQNQVWTAKSNADRGLPHAPQVHLGAAKTNRARSGEYVADNEENHQQVLRSKAAVIDDDLRHLDEALAREQEVQRAIVRRWARSPAVPIRLPEPAIAATLATAPPPPARGVPLAPPIVAPSPLPVGRAVPSLIAKPIPSLARRALPQVDLGHLDTAGNRPLPAISSVVTLLDFANLRKPVARIELPVSPGHAPSTPSHAMPVSPLSPLRTIRQSVDPARMPARPSLPMPVHVRTHPFVPFPVTSRVRRIDIPAAPQPLPRRPAQTSRLPSFSPLPPDVPVLRLETVRAAQRQLAAKLRAADEQQKRDKTTAATKAVGDASADAATLERRRRIVEACRILSRSPRRPYRVQGDRVTLDLDVMGRRERNAVTGAGPEEREIVDALIARARRDRAEDERAQAEGRAIATPLNRLTMLGRVADQRETATSTWVASGRLDAQGPFATEGGVEPGPRSGFRDRAATAAIAARLHDRQRGG